MLKALITTIAVLTAAWILAAVSGAASPPVHYYLSLGDSLSQGQQPDVEGVTRNTGQGYPDLLYVQMRRRIPGLRLVKLGCGGESTSSMITGKGNKLAKRFHCHPAGGSQLRAAVRFLRAHHARGEVPVLTVDLGASNLAGCAKLPTSQIGSCVSAGEAKMKHDFPIILGRLSRAAAQGTAFVGMNLYDPVLAQYFNSDPQQRALAKASVPVAKHVNGIIESADTKAGFKTADVAKLFGTYDTVHTVMWEGQKVPLDVATVCSWTWACATPPSGPRLYPNKNGYAEISLAFYARLVKRGRGKH